jgi:CheY-like chemotaxis protein
MTDKLKPRVLVIEDNPDFGQLLCDILTIQGCVTEVAHEALLALEMARAAPYDVIFSDINLPGTVSGLGFARLLRADPQLSHTPLIAVSGYTADEDRQRALDAGFNLVFPKPVKFADLSMALATYSRSGN